MTDKEKLEKALVHLKKYIDGDFVTDDEILADFPELKESEDERIRKFLLEYAIEMIAGLESDISLSTYDGIKGHDPDAEAELTQWQKARAYLERLKEQKPCEDNGTDGDIMQYIEEGEKRGIKEVISFPEKYGLQKKQKPAWSEEDEKKIHFLSRLIEFQVKDDEYCFGEGFRMISKQEAVEMLKSLRPS